MNEKKHFQLNDKVNISNEHHWAKNAIGIVTKYPFDFEDENWIENYYREIKTLKGIVRFYWVNFNESQFLQDEGFYHAAEIESEYLRLI